MRLVLIHYQSHDCVHQAKDSARAIDWREKRRPIEGMAKRETTLTVKGKGRKVEKVERAARD